MEWINLAEDKEQWQVLMNGIKPSGSMMVHFLVAQHQTASQGLKFVDLS
jgi:hypothetical protein